MDRSLQTPGLDSWGSTDRSGQGTGGGQRDQAAMKLSQGWSLSREAIKGALSRQWSSKGHFSIGVAAGGCCHGPEAEQ